MTYRRWIAIGACLLLAACSPPDDGGDTSPDGNSSDADGRADATGDAEGSLPTGPCSVVASDAGDRLATFFYDDEDRLEGVAANGRVLELRQDVRGWARTRFFDCQIQGSNRAERRSSFDSCISGDLKKEVRYDKSGGRLETAEASPTPEMFKIEIDYQYSDGRLAKEERTRPDTPRYMVINAEYSYPSGKVQRTEGSHPNEEYRFDTSQKPHAKRAICLMQINDEDEFPRGRCKAIADTSGAVASSDKGSETTEYRYADDGRLEELVRGGTTYEASYGCW